MRINSKAEIIALNPKRQPKPVKFWQAIDKTGTVVAENNSVALLRHKFGNTVFYKAIR